MSSSYDHGALSRAWHQRWPDRRPIGHELRGGDDWVRLHSLPESKRYAESESERTEVLRRHNTVIAELVASSSKAVDALAVVNCSWSNTPAVVPRDHALDAVSPSATHWQSMQRDVGADDDQWWTHLYVDVVTWKPGELDDLLLLVAADRTAGVLLGPIDWEWLYHPYDGGADVIAANVQLRVELRDRHRDWLSTRPDGL